MDILPGVARNCMSGDTLCPVEGENAMHEMNPLEYLHSLDFLGLPSHSLELNEGLPIILLINLNKS